MLVEGKRMRGCPKKKWDDSERLYMDELTTLEDMPSYIRVCRLCIKVFE